MPKRFTAATVRRLLPMAATCLLLPTLLHAAEAPQAANDARLAPPFDRYRAWRDGDMTDWRAANVRVGEVGGWRTYLRESASEQRDDGHDGAHGQH